MNSTGSTKILVAQATRDNFDPPGGYSLNELAKLSLASITQCQAIEEAIMSRLSSSSPNVKWKSLRVIRHLCTNGHANMKKAFQRHNDVLRQCANFTGSSHPLKGDALNERVRVAAKEAMNALFATSVDNRNATFELKKKISGFGGGDAMGGSDDAGLHQSTGTYGQTESRRYNDDSGAPSVPSMNPHHGTYQNPALGGGAAKRMVGFGNTGFEPSKSNQDESFFGKVKQTIESSLGNGFLRRQSDRTHQPFMDSSQYAAPESRMAFDVQPARADVPFGQRARGHVGGSWASVQTTTINSGPPGRTFKPEPPTPSEALPAANNAQEVQPEDSYYVRSLVNEATAPGGIASGPAPESLARIVDGFRDLNQHQLLTILNERLRAGPVQSQIRALLVLDSLARHYGDIVVPFFKVNAETLTDLAISSHRTLRLKAENTLLSLGLNRVPGTSGSQETPIHQEDMINFESMNQQHDSIFGQNEHAPSVQVSSETPDLLTGSLMADSSGDLRGVDDSIVGGDTDRENLFSNMEVKYAESSDPLEFLRAVPGSAYIADGAEAQYESLNAPATFDPIEAARIPRLRQEKGASSAFEFLSTGSHATREIPVENAPVSAFPFVGIGDAANQAQSLLSSVDDAFSHLNTTASTLSSTAHASHVATQLFSLNGAPIRQPTYVQSSRDEISPLRNVGKRTSTTDQFSFVQDMMNGPILTGSP